MGLINNASCESAWRGYEYHLAKRVKKLKNHGDGTFSALVDGCDGARYEVTLNLNKIRSSKCNCPYANGRKVICKHLVATYFKAFPEEAKRYYQGVLEAEKEAEECREQEAKNVEVFIKKMKKADLCDELLEILEYGPEWQYDQFVRKHDLYVYDE